MDDTQDAAPPRDEALRWGTPAARGALLATVLGSSLTFLAATSINVALPALAADLGAEVSPCSGRSTRTR